MKKLTEAWLRAAKDDLDVIERIIKDDHLSHVVAFHAQQGLEKLFKAVIEEHDIETQKIHKLVSLYGRIESFLGEELDLQLLKTLDALYIEARYPGELGLLPNGRPTQDDAKRFYAYLGATFKRVSKYLA